MKKLSKNIFDLDPERLATTDEFGNRVYLYPEDVKGPWKNRRTVLYWILIGVYLILPWININNKPSMMVDVFKQEFTFMGFTLYGVEPLIFFPLLASGLFFVAFMTSRLGRVWCGWACPQTVFIQSIFIKIEALIEGKSRQRRELEKAPWSMKKLLKVSCKWVVFILVSLHIAHTFIGYFVGPRELLMITTHTPSENWGLFVGTMIVALIVLIDFGWFREQFCIIVCPYGRIQSVLMDEHSLVVAYDAKRGEPRRGVGDGVGDCINCYNCVKVCPTGIDIRRGTQLECIQCTQCIDACDEIMTKIKKPKGLIRYSTENEISGKTKKTITVRDITYGIITIGLFLLFIFMINRSTHLDLVFLRSKVPFAEIEVGKLVINNFTLKISHQGSEEYRVELRLQDLALRDKIQVVVPSQTILVNMPDIKSVVFFKFHPDILIQGSRKIMIDVVDIETKIVMTSKEVTLVGPVN